MQFTENQVQQSTAGVAAAPQTNNSVFGDRFKLLALRKNDPLKGLAALPNKSVEGDLAKLRALRQERFGVRNLPTLDITAIQTSVAAAIVEESKSDTQVITEQIMQEADTNVPSQRILQSLDALARFRKVKNKNVRLSAAQTILSTVGVIAKNIVIGAVAGILAYALFWGLAYGGVIAAASSAASAAGGAGSWWLSSYYFQAFYAAAKLMGYDKKAIQNMWRVVKRSRYAASILNSQPIPTALNGTLKFFHVPDYMIAASLETMLTTVTTEMFSMMNGNAAAYAIYQAQRYSGAGEAISYTIAQVQQKGAGGVLKESAAVTWDAALEAIDGLRHLASKTGIQEIVGNFIKTKNLAEVVVAQTNTITESIQTKFIETEKIARGVTVVKNTAPPDRQLQPRVPLQSLAQLTANRRKVGVATKQSILQQATASVLNLSNVLATSAAIGTTLAIGLYTGQNLADNSFIRQTAFSLIATQTGVTDFIGKFAGTFVSGHLGKLKNLNAALLDPKISFDKRSELTKSFFSFIMGETIYSNEQIADMSADEIKKVFKANGVQVSEKDLSNTSARFWRDALLKHQQSILSITQEAFIESLTTQLVKGASAALLTKGMDMAYENYPANLLEAVNLGSLARFAGLSNDEIAAVNVASNSPQFVEQQMQQGGIAPLVDAVPSDAIDGVNKMKTYLREHPEIAAELKTGTEPTSGVLIKTNGQPIDEVGIRNQTERANLQLIREERREQRKLLDASNSVRQIERVQKYAIKHGLTTAQMEGLKNMRDLQRAIADMTSTATKTELPVQFTATPEQLIGEELYRDLAGSEFTPLYAAVKKAAAHTAAFYAGDVADVLLESSTGTAGLGIGKLLSKATGIYNAGVDTINIGKNTYNLATAVNRLVNPLIQATTEPNGWLASASTLAAAYLPLMPAANLPAITNAGEILAEALGANVTVNTRQLFIEATIQSLRNQWSTTQLLMYIATKSAGADAAQSDIDKIMGAFS